MTPSVHRAGRRRAARAALGGAIGLGLALPLVALAASGGTETPSAAPSFTRDVAPIIQQKCAGCHRTGGVTPFPLETARGISTHAGVIAAAVQARLMPPWPPGSRSPAFAGETERTLTARERTTILAWARAGGRVDGPARKPLPREPVVVKEGESVLEVAMSAAYRPRAATGVTDDYRCFVLDPKLSGDVSVTSARIQPGASRIVHHVILFRISAAQVAEAARLDSASPGLGWTCFGGTGIGAGGTAGSVQAFLNDSNWIAAWAPGSSGGRLPDGNGVPLPAGSRIVMQVHYNLLNGKAPDRSRAVLTVAPASTGLAHVQTVLLPAPVELACAKGERGRLCNRTEALSELSRKYGSTAAFAPTALLLLCGRSTSNVSRSPVSSCDRRIDAPTNILAVAGHMHLLGASIRLELNPGTPRARVLLDIPRWDFHWQSAYILSTPIQAKPGDVVRVTCRHDVTKRIRAHHGIPKTPRYILWGEGTTDEMCLGLLQVTRG
jgi:Copper type II ascorbate-dependent monooxygenase, C-terminal domain